MTKADKNALDPERRKRKRKRRKKKNKALTILGTLICTLIMLIQVAGGVLLCMELYTLDMLPVRYLAVIGVVVAIMALIQLALIVQRGLTSFIVSALLGLCFVGVEVLGIVYVQKTDDTLRSISSKTVTTTLDEVSIAVLASSDYEDLEALAGCNFAVQQSVDRTNTDKTIESLQDLLADNMTVNEYNGIYDMVQALYTGTDQVIVFNEAYRDLIVDSFDTFNDDIRVLNTYTYTSTIVVDEPKEEEEQITVNVALQDPFILYFSGIDTYGDVGTKSRSDVNIIATVNPKTRQILLVTTPRDYYVELALGNHPLDKLTHAGIYGIDCSIQTLEDLYGIDINYYMRLNFTGFMDIVDALGGVDVYSEQNFTGEVGNYSFTVGTNHVNGKEALCFVRERHTFKDGDAQRARNQMAMIKAVVEKATSPSILTGYTDILKSISKSFVTSMGGNDIATLVKMQLDDGRPWTINSYSTLGTPARRTTYSMGSMNLYVALQNQKSIDHATYLMQSVLDGKELTEEDINSDAVLPENGEPGVTEDMDADMVDAENADQEAAQ